VFCIHLFSSRFTISLGLRGESFGEGFLRIGHPNRAMRLFSCFRFGKTRDKRTKPVSNNGKRRGRRRRRGQKSLSPVESGSGNRASQPPVGRTSLTYSLDHTVSGGYASPRSALSDEDNYFDTNEDQYATPASIDSHGHAGSAGEYVDEDDEGLDTLAEHETLWDRLTHWLSSLTTADKPNQELESSVIEGSGHVEVATDGPESLEISTSGLTIPNRSSHGKVTQKVKRVIIEDDGGDSPTAAPTGCIGFLTASQVALAHKKFLRKARPKAGGSFTRRTPDLDEASAACAYEPVEASAFQVRSLDYMRSGKKQPSHSSIYRLLGVDMFTFDRKAYHIAQHVELPKVGLENSASGYLLGSHGIPPLLIINLQLPMYAPSIFGKNDGPGHSLVYYFGLPDDWTPEQVGNSAALGLLQRFVADGTEFDGQRTRDRLKLIPRIVNVEEWASVSRLSGTEVRLLKNYNGKPILTRPQQKFFLAQDKSYFEIDLDVHSFAYIARRAYYGYIDRLSPVVFENAFVLQGNRKEELPEVILGAVRVFRVDFRKARPFPTMMT
jgi:hypothetical protein